MEINRKFSVDLADSDAKVIDAMLVNGIKVHDMERWCVQTNGPIVMAGPFGNTPEEAIELWNKAVGSVV